MPDHEPTAPYPVPPSYPAAAPAYPGVAPPTRDDAPPPSYPSTVTTASTDSAYPLPPLDDGYEDDYDDEEWVNAAPKGIRVQALTGVLALVLFAVIGLWGGAIWQKHHDNKTIDSRVESALASAVSSRRSAAGGTGGTGTGTGTGGFGGFGGGAAGRTTGTVTDVEGTTVSVTNAAGTVVKFTLAPTTKITQTVTAPASAVQIGSTVIVTGTAGSSATAIILEPAGTTFGSGTGGFGGSTGGGG